MITPVEELGSVHVIGIGGAGMSGIARILVERGVPVSGSDAKESRRLAALRALGVRTFVGHAADQLGDAQTVIFSTAIPESNPERAAAQQRGLRVLGRADALASVLLDEADPDAHGPGAGRRPVPHGVRGYVPDGRHRAVRIHELDDPALVRHSLGLGSHLAPVVVLARRGRPLPSVVGRYQANDAIRHAHGATGQKNSIAMPSGSRAVTAHP